MGPAAPIIGLALTAASTVMSVVGGLSSSSQQAALARQQYNQQQQIAQRNYQLQSSEIDRQQQEVSEIAQKQATQRRAEASRELGTLRVVAGESGMSGSTFNSMVQELGFYEGMDLSTIESNRSRNIEKGQSEKEFARQGVINTISIAKTQAEVGLANAQATKWSAIGTGLRLAGQMAGGIASSNAQAAAIERERSRMNPR
jgi:hypothetical protein